MSKGEETKEEAQFAGTHREQSSPADLEVPPMIQKALEMHRRDLPELIKRHADEWVAYRGAERLEFGRSKRAIYYKYLDRGLSLDELVVLGVEPELPEELDPSEWSQW
jgi:hypothetical protein